MGSSTGNDLEQAVAWLEDADGLLITAGAGMGIEGGLPDFRDSKGFWRTYPAVGREGLRFEEMASPAAFHETPRLAWGVYGLRLNLCRDTAPHAGYGILRRWAKAMPRGAFVYTSNVDGHFERAGFAPGRIAESHGSIHTLQCLRACTHDLWSADTFHPVVDEATTRLTSVVPTCPHCGAVARPNILMSNDWKWVPDRVLEQHWRLEEWLAGLRRLVVVEVGATMSMPALRMFGERHSPRVIRINRCNAVIAPDAGVGLRGPVLEGLRRIDERYAPTRMVGT
jgi:NAD-dependent SIR2 family protein deacetylase